MKQYKLQNEERFKEEYENGDIWGLIEIEKQLIEQNISENEDIKKLLNDIIRMNLIVIDTETEKWAGKYETEIKEIYWKMLKDLFDMLSIKEIK